MQSPTNVYNCTYYHLVKELRIKIHQLNSYIKELEDSKTSLRTAKKSIASTFIIIENQLAKAKSQIKNFKKEYSLVSNKLKKIII